MTALTPAAAGAPAVPAPTPASRPATPGDAGELARSAARQRLEKSARRREARKKFEWVVLSVAAGEAFPNAQLSTPLQLHLGCVPHQHGRWMPPPADWKAVPTAKGEGEGLAWGRVGGAAAL